MIIGIDASRANRDQRTGVEEYAYHIIQELKHELPDTVRVVLYSDTPLTGALAELPPHWRSKVLWWPPRRLWTQLRLSCEMLVSPPDVLFIPAHVYPVVRPKQTIMTIHDVAARRFPRAYNRFERWYSLSTAKRANQTLAHVIVPSEFTKKELGAYTHAVNDRVVVIPHGCRPPVRSIDQSADVLERFGIRKPYFLFVGRIEEKKNVTSLVRAFWEVRKTYPDAHLVLAGKPGYGYDEIRSLLRHDADNIHELGYVSAQDLPLLYVHARTFVFPSWYEGFGLPVLEALSYGTPVIAAQQSCLEEVGGDVCVYVDPHDTPALAKAMKQMLSVPQDALFAARAKAHAAQFSWREAAKKTAAVLVSHMTKTG